MNAWLSSHIETFIKPYLDGVCPKPYFDSIKDDKKSNFYQIQLGDENLTILYALWMKARLLAGDKPILLPGRDMWIFELFARLDNTPTTFRPDISSITSPFIAEDYTSYCMIDTGYVGTCALMMGIPTYYLVSCRSNPDHCITGAKHLYAENCPFMEGIPKYWNRAFMAGDPEANSYYAIRYQNDPYYVGRHQKMKIKIERGSPITQTLAAQMVFATAASVTLHIAQRFAENPSIRERGKELALTL